MISTDRRAEPAGSPPLTANQSGSAGFFCGIGLLLLGESIATMDGMSSELSRQNREEPTNQRATKDMMRMPSFPTHRILSFKHRLHVAGYQHIATVVVYSIVVRLDTTCTQDTDRFDPTWTTIVKIALQTVEASTRKCDWLAFTIIDNIFPRCC